MKKIKATRYFNYAKHEYEYTPTKYTDFYCSIREWSRLGRGRSNFMYQLRAYIADKYNLHDDSRPDTNCSFDRTGRRDGLESEIYSANIIRAVIKEITHVDSEVDYFSWKGTLDHIVVSFPNKSMPNYVFLIDDYESSTNGTLIDIMSTIYDDLKYKTYDWFKHSSCSKYFNTNYDRIVVLNEHTSEYANYVILDKYFRGYVPTKTRIEVDRVSVGWNTSTILR